MKKGQKIEAFVESLSTGSTHDPCYEGYFICFNEQKYYEAHDVLEHLWLKEQGPAHQFFKGLIQLAGAFVHLQKQYRRPEHATDGRRLRPAWRLFKLAQTNLEPYLARLSWISTCVRFSSFAQKTCWRSRERSSRAILGARSLRRLLGFACRREPSNDG